MKMALFDISFIQLKKIFLDVDRTSLQDNEKRYTFFIRK